MSIQQRVSRTFSKLFCAGLIYSRLEAGKLHGKIWRIDTYIKGDMEDEIELAADEDRRLELKKEKENLKKTRVSYFNIWSLLFDPQEKGKRNSKEKRTAADEQFTVILAHPVGPMRTQKLELDWIEYRLRAELGYAQEIPEPVSGGDPNVRRRAPGQGSSSS